MVSDLFGEKGEVFSGSLKLPTVVAACSPYSAGSSARCSVGPAAISHSSESTSSNYMVYCFIIHPTSAAPATILLAFIFRLLAHLPLHALQSHPALSHPGSPLVSVNNMLHFSYAFRNSISIPTARPGLYFTASELRVSELRKQKFQGQIKVASVLYSLMHTSVQVWPHLTHTHNIHTQITYVCSAHTHHIYTHNRQHTHTYTRHASHTHIHHYTHHMQYTHLHTPHIHKTHTSHTYHIYIQCAHIMHTTCTHVYAIHIHKTHTIYAHTSHTPHTQNTHHIYTQHTRHTHTHVYTTHTRKYIHKTHRTHTHCTHTTQTYHAHNHTHRHIKRAQHMARAVH